MKVYTQNTMNKMQSLPNQKNASKMKKQNSNNRINTQNLAESISPLKSDKISDMVQACSGVDDPSAHKPESPEIREEIR